MQKPIETLLNIKQNKLAYIAKAVLISIVPATIIAYLVYQINPSTNQQNVDLPVVDAITQLVIIAPVIETLIMWPILSGLGRWTKDNLVLTAFLSACLWAMFHALFNLNWGFTILWPFFVFSFVFCVWKKKSVLWALSMTASVHALQNLLAVTYLHTF